jgi:hypothetical protein
MLHEPTPLDPLGGDGCYWSLPKANPDITQESNSVKKKRKKKAHDIYTEQVSKKKKIEQEMRI